MGKRSEKQIIAAIAVALVYGGCAYAFCSDAATCEAARSTLSMPVPGQFILALVPTALFAFFLTVDTALPIGRSVIDMTHDGLVAMHRHLFIAGEQNNYWHLRIAIALSAIIAVQIISSTVECLRGS